jgi:RNA polymerase sigma factor (sigma-70 family)
MGSAAQLTHLHRLAARAWLNSEPDAELLRRFIHERDADAFAALVERHGPMVLNLSRRLLGDAHDAEDAFQATFLQLSRFAASIRKPESLAAWLYGTTRRIALKLRARRRVAAPGLETLVGGTRDPLEEISARELLTILEEELNRLPETYRLPLILCAIEGLPVAEAATRLRESVGVVRGRLERGRAKLGARLARRGIALPAALSALLAVPRVAPSAALVESVLGISATVVPVPPAVASLAEVGGYSLKLKLAGVAVLAAAGLGIALVPGGAEPPAEKAPTVPVALRDSAERAEPLPPGAIARFGTLRMRGCAAPVAFSPNGRLIACAASDSRSRVILWDRATGQFVRSLEADARVSLRFSPDDKKVLAYDGGNNQSVWDVETGERLYTAEGRLGVFTRDGKRLISLGLNAQIYDVDATTGRRRSQRQLPDELPTGPPPPPPFSSSAERRALSPDGRAYVYHKTAREGKDSGLVLRDLVKGAEIAALDFEGRCHGAAFSPDGKRLAAAGNDEVRVWDAKTGEELAHWKQRSDSAPVFSADGSRVAWSGFDNVLGVAYVWIADVKDGKPKHVGLPTNSFSAPALSADGKIVALIDDGGALVLRDAQTGKDLAPIDGHTGRVWGAQFTPDGRHIVTRDRNRFLVWERAASKLLRRYPDDLPEGERQLPDGTSATYVLTAADSGTLRLRELVTGREVLKMEGKDSWVGGVTEPVSVSVDGSTAALVSKDYNIRVYDLTTGKRRCTFDPEAAVWSVRLATDGRYLLVLCQDRKKGEEFILDTRTGREVDAARLPRQAFAHTEMSDGRFIATGPYAFEWLKKQKLLGENGKPLPADWYMAGCTVYRSPGGRYVAVRGIVGKRGEIDREGRPRIWMWEAATGKLLKYFDPPGRVEEHALFSADGRTFVTTALDGTAHLWEVATGQERATLRGHSGEVTALAFTPDGRGLVSGGADTQVLLWDITGRCPDGVWKEAPLSNERRRELWDELAGQDAAKAYRAIWELTSDPAGTVEFLKEHIQKAEAADPERVAKLVEALNADAFALREKASAELARFGEATLPALRQALKDSSTAEQRERLEKLLGPLEKSELTGERLRQARAVEVLEHIATAEAKQLLEHWATGLAEARLTQEAKAVLQRMNR